MKNTETPEVPPTIVLEDKEYDLHSLNDDAKYCVQQIEDLRQQMSATKARFDQLSMAEAGFIEKLKGSVKDADYKQLESKEAE